MPRLFIAMEADEDIRSSMGKTIKELRSFGDSIRPVDINNLHITLKFIGDTDEKKSLILKKAFENSEIPAGKISCAIRGLGVFPGLVSPSVIWCGLADHDGRIRSVAKAMEDMTAELGFPGESRPFRAHITLARMRRDSIISDELRDYILNNRDTLYGESSFGRIILFKSQLTKSGPLYTKLAEKLLGAAGR